MDCVFCKIISGEIASDILYEDETVVAFNDLNPVAPIHVLVIPKVHISCSNDINSDNSSIISDVFEAIPSVCKQLGIKEYRIVNNCGPGAGQTVSHIHFHILGGREFKWPPG